MPSSCARFPIMGMPGSVKSAVGAALAGLVTGLKIKYFSESALKGHACAQKMAGLKPTAENHLIGMTDTEWLGIYLLARQMDIQRDILCYRM